MKAKHLIILILITIVNKVIGQPSTEVEELFRKRHTISGMSYGHPYTTFDTHNLNYVDLPNAINNIRKRIIKEKGKPLAESPIFTAYQDIYKNATDPMPTDNGMPKNGISGLALWAKNNAFVFLIGLDSNGNYIDTGFSVATRNAFRDKAVSAFDHLNGNIDVPSTSPWLLTIPIAGALVYTSVYLKHLSDEQDYLGKIQEQCRSSALARILRVSLLKASGYIPPTVRSLVCQALA